MNEISDKEKIEKSIKIFYKTLLNREDTISMPYEKTYPHVFSGSKTGKIGLFKFSK